MGTAARARGHLALSGRAAEFEAELPFGVSSHALDDWLFSVAPTRLEALAGGLAAQLAVVLPAFEPLATVRTPQIPQERNRAYRAVRSLLSSIAEATATPVVLVRDDIHWADPGSVELLCHLLAHPPGAPSSSPSASGPHRCPRASRARWRWPSTRLRDSVWTRAAECVGGP